MLSIALSQLNVEHATYIESTCRYATDEDIMSSDEDVKLYSTLERNKKRQMMVSLSSSSDDEDGDEDCQELTILVTPTKRRKECLPSRKTSLILTRAGRKRLNESDEDDDDLRTSSEREAEELRKQSLEKEIREILEKDKLLNQTRAILEKVSTTKRQTTINNMKVISLDSDSNDERDEVVIAENVVPYTKRVVDKGSRITLQLRSNGGAVDEICVHKKETFDQLHTKFCELHGLPRSAVILSLDGEALRHTETPESVDLESGDIVEAKVDYSKQSEASKKTYIRLRLVVFGKRSEVFKIDSTATAAKLHWSFCQRHGITNPDDVVMSINDQDLRLNENLKFYGLIDNDEILVKVKKVEAQPQTIDIQL
ncbi:hypothetical protein CCR75_005403 [Bremia lactucae]|uniref:Ubiquitin-like domain-containing protein n=1 Tax=Bremia lactucae TaxID=4779 RepID=A0A976IBV1_BRELC|nr:hypothetical protein CCR75_005403 [Bremia lactucae]